MDHKESLLRGSKPADINLDSVRFYQQFPHYGIKHDIDIINDDFLYHGGRYSERIYGPNYRFYITPTYKNVFLGVTFSEPVDFQIECNTSDKFVNIKSYENVKSLDYIIELYSNATQNKCEYRIVTDGLTKDVYLHYYLFPEK